MHVDSLSAIEDLGEGHSWFKLVFDVVEAKHTTNDAASVEFIVIRALGSTPRGEIGFEVSVPLSGWTEEELTSGLNVDWGKVVFLSIGRSTDRLLALLEEQFGHPPSQSVATSELPCTAVLLADDPGEMQTAEMHMKLFFDANAEADPESYAELYFNFDLPARRAWLMEKDIDYRTPLISWLSGQYRHPSERVN